MHYRDHAKAATIACYLTTPFIVFIVFVSFSEKPGSWADEMLEALGYNKNPKKLQEIIRQVYKHATNEIKEVRSMIY